LPANWELDWIKAISRTHAFAVGTFGVMLHTVDGSTWQTMTHGADLPLARWTDVDAVDATHVWAVGTLGDGQDDRAGRVIAFYDGVEWRPQVIPPDPTKPTCNALIGLSVVDTQTAWAVGGGNCTALKTLNGGVTWQLAGDLGAGILDVNRVVAVSAHQAWATTDAAIRLTVDGGQTYTSTAATGQFFYGITAASPKVAWAVTMEWSTTESHLLRTLDGVQWAYRPVPVGAPLNGISFVGARR
jgi:hypothetical protein